MRNKARDKRFGKKPAVVNRSFNRPPKYKEDEEEKAVEKALDSLRGQWYRRKLIKIA